MDEEAVPWDSILLGKRVEAELWMCLSSSLSETSGSVGVESLGELLSTDHVLIPITDVLGTSDGILHATALFFVWCSRTRLDLLDEIGRAHV